jgi:hypothetical protein
MSVMMTTARRRRWARSWLVTTAVAAQMAAVRTRFPFELVFMVGDNIVGRQSDPSDFVAKFERPFAVLLKSGVRFYAARGNHDKAANRFYQPLNTGGQRYYTFVRRNVPFLRAR